LIELAPPLLLSFPAFMKYVLAEKKHRKSRQTFVSTLLLIESRGKLSFQRFGGVPNFEKWPFAQSWRPPISSGSSCLSTWLSSWSS
jgi:hypothetical protein